MKKKRSSSKRRPKGKASKRHAYHYKELHAAEDVTKDAVHFLKAAVLGAILPDMKDFTKDAVHTGQNILYHTEDIMLTRIYSMVLLGCGGLILLIGLIYLAEIYFNFHRAWTLLGLGLLMIAGSRIIHSKMRRREYYSFK